MKVIAFYTIGTPYAEVVKELEASLQALGLDYDIQGYYNRGSWVANCAIKPEFIKAMLIAHPDQDLLYVDADAMIRKIPDFSAYEDDNIAVHYLTHRTGTLELLSGTIYLRNCTDTRKLVQAWLDHQQSNPTVWDQKTLQQVVDTGDYRVGILPPEYTKIFDKDMCPGVEPVIEHYQASRKYKKEIMMDSVTKQHNIPSTIDGIRVRKGADGGFALPRCSKDTEERLDKMYVRCPGELRWYPHCIEGLQTGDVRPYFSGRGCYYVGKGPSLDKVTAKTFADTNDPIICINESIHKIEPLDLPNPLFVMQQDGGLAAKCLPKKDDTIMILSQMCKNYYADKQNKIIFTTPNAAITVIQAIEFARGLGSIAGTMVAFDASTNKATDYADCIGYSPKKGGAPERFLKHRRLIDKASVGYSLKWL